MATDGLIFILSIRSCSISFESTEMNCLMVCSELYFAFPATSRFFSSLQPSSVVSLTSDSYFVVHFLAAAIAFSFSVCISVRQSASLRSSFYRCWLSTSKSMASWWCSPFLWSFTLSSRMVLHLVVANASRPFLPFILCFLHTGNIASLSCCSHTLAMIFLHPIYVFSVFCDERLWFLLQLLVLV